MTPPKPKTPPHNTMFGQRNLRRRLAAQMLLVWLFALTTGIVNACVIGPELRQAAQSAAHELRGGGRAHPHEQTNPQAHPQVLGMASQANGHPPQQVDNAPCAKFCAGESVSAPVLKR